MSQFKDIDPSAEGRKGDHIQLAFNSQINSIQLDSRFNYEPMLAGHPSGNNLPEFILGTQKMTTPIWVSSMTGGTAMAATINKNLAKACADFGMGMGLGSCRSLLSDSTHLEDFAVRKYIGSQPLYANLGIAQIEKLIHENKLHLIDALLDKLEADGLIIHVNPLQEWLQPEGDRYTSAPITLIEQVLEKKSYKLIVKEVGHGFGPKSMEALMRLPLTAIDFGANGGTNFSKIELARNNDDGRKNSYNDLTYLGHNAEEMVHMANSFLNLNNEVLCKHFIISGGVKTFLDGYYLIQKILAPAVYGQAAGLLQYAMGDYDPLHQHLTLQIEGLKLASALLTVKNSMKHGLQ